MTDDVKGDGTPLKCGHGRLYNDHPRCGVTELLTELRATRERLAEVEKLLDMWTIETATARSERDAATAKFAEAHTRATDFQHNMHEAIGRARNAESERDAAIKGRDVAIANRDRIAAEIVKVTTAYPPDKDDERSFGDYYIAMMDAAIKRAEEAEKKAERTAEFRDLANGRAIELARQLASTAIERDALQSRVEELEREVAKWRDDEQRRKDAYGALNCPLCGDVMCAHRERWDFAALRDYTLNLKSRYSELERLLAEGKR